MRRNDMNDTTEVAKYGDVKGFLSVQQVESIMRDGASMLNSMAQIRKSDRQYDAMCKTLAQRKAEFHGVLKKIEGQDKAIDALIGQIENGMNQNNTEILLKAMDKLADVASSNPWESFFDFNRRIDAGEEFVID
jgi:predicted patatin/cPLA2 family phospholipase